MKTYLIVAMCLFGAGPLHAKSDANLAFYGVINSVGKSAEGVSIEVTGIARLTIDDPTLKDRRHYLSLQHSVLELRFNSGIKGMATYSKFRYLDFIDGEQAVSLLNEFQKNGSEVRLILNAEAISYSSNDEGLLKPTSLKGTLHEVAPWTSLYKESISEYTKDMSVSYESVLRREADGEETVDEADKAEMATPRKPSD